MRTLTLVCVATTLAMSPALAGEYFPWASYGWRPTVSYRDYYAPYYSYYYPFGVVVPPDGHYWRRPHRRYR